MEVGLNSDVDEADSGQLDLTSLIDHKGGNDAGFNAGIARTGWIVRKLGRGGLQPLRAKRDDND